MLKNAKWEDVREKGEAIFASGGVEIVSETKDEIEAYVMSGVVSGEFPVSDGGPYHVILSKRTWQNRRNVGGWVQGYLCDCTWGYYNSGEPGPRYQGRFCFEPDSLVLMADGSYKAISEMQVGDMVQSKNGPRRVLNVFENDYDGDMVEMSFSGSCFPVRMTIDHNVLSNAELDKWLETHSPIYGNRNSKSYGLLHDMSNWSGFKQAGDFNVGDLVLFGAASETEHREYISFADILGDNIYVEDGLAYWVWDKPKAWRGGRWRSLNPIKETIRFDDDFAYVLGWYLAEGSIEGHRNKQTGEQANSIIRWSLSSDEIDVAENILSILESWGCVGASIYDYSYRGSIVVKVSSRPLAELFIYMCGSSSKTKMLSREVMLADTAWQEAFLSAYHNGDGTKKGSGKCIYTSSAILARQISQIVQRVYGVDASVHCNANSLGPVARLLGDTGSSMIYHIDYNCDYTQRRYAVDDFHTAHKVQVVRAYHKTGKVWNIEVEGEHIYCVEGLLVHNCSHAYAALLAANARARNDFMNDRTAALLEACEDFGFRWNPCMLSDGSYVASYTGRRATLFKPPAPTYSLDSCIDAMRAAILGAYIEVKDEDEWERIMMDDTDEYYDEVELPDDIREAVYHDWLDGVGWVIPFSIYQCDETQPWYGMDYSDALQNGFDFSAYDYKFDGLFDNDRKFDADERVTIIFIWGCIENGMYPDWNGKHMPAYSDIVEFETGFYYVGPTGMILINPSVKGKQMAASKCAGDYFDGTSDIRLNQMSVDLDGQRYRCVFPYTEDDDILEIVELADGEWEWLLYMDDDMGGGLLADSDYNTFPTAQDALDDFNDFVNWNNGSLYASKKTSAFWVGNNSYGFDVLSLMGTDDGWTADIVEMSPTEWSYEIYDPEGYCITEGVAETEFEAKQWAETLVRGHGIGCIDDKVSITTAAKTSAILMPEIYYEDGAIVIDADGVMIDDLYIDQYDVNTAVEWAIETLRCYDIMDEYDEDDVEDIVRGIYEEYGSAWRSASRKVAQEFSIPPFDQWGFWYEDLEDPDLPWDECAMEGNYSFDYMGHEVNVTFQEDVYGGKYKFMINAQNATYESYWDVSYNGVRPMSADTVAALVDSEFSSHADELQKVLDSIFDPSIWESHIEQFANDNGLYIQNGRVGNSIDLYFDSDFAEESPSIHCVLQDWGEEKYTVYWCEGAADWYDPSYGEDAEWELRNQKSQTFTSLEDAYNFMRQKTGGRRLASGWTSEVTEYENRWVGEYVPAKGPTYSSGGEPPEYPEFDGWATIVLKRDNVPMYNVYIIDAGMFSYEDFVMNDDYMSYCYQGIEELGEEVADALENFDMYPEDWSEGSYEEVIKYMLDRKEYDYEKVGSIKNAGTEKNAKIYNYNVEFADGSTDSFQSYYRDEMILTLATSEEDGPLHIVKYDIFDKDYEPISDDELARIDTAIERERKRHANRIASIKNATRTFTYAEMQELEDEVIDKPWLNNADRLKNPDILVSF